MTKINGRAVHERTEQPTYRIEHTEGGIGTRERLAS